MPPTTNPYTPSTPIWLPDPTHVWKCYTITAHTPGTTDFTVQDPDDLAAPPKTVKCATLPHLRNPEILIGQNDLTTLSYLHEPAVLHNLQYRFNNNNTIYTYCGIVLVAINPYEELDIYNKETILAYRGSGNELDPHIFAVAESSYSKMERDSHNQSIIVSGESGAGKTVSAKYAMRYFATVGGSENETQIEQKVLASQPLMEAIGNAKTTRNDNSSRFGKYVELHFTPPRFSITGASMRTYLLEKSRVVYQSPSERNYHIFYQITDSTHSELSELYLQPSSNFTYTRTGSNLPNSETDSIRETIESLTLLGFGLDNRRNFFKILAGILQLGNINFRSGSHDESTIAKDDLALKYLCDLWNLDQDVLRKSLVTKELKSGMETVTKKLSVNEATYAKDALAKLIYSELFNWVVRNINGALLKYCGGEKEGAYKFIGVLDIYGFETFQTNSFEQFCINYANEKLQQQFNLHVFKLEQQEYIREGIQWTMIDFHDNQPCIDLIEAKLGILDLLDEECRMGAAGSDKSWVLKLNTKCIDSKHFVKPKIDSDKGFIVKHFADDVRYDCGGFIEKNRDMVGGSGGVDVVAGNPFLSKEILKEKLEQMVTQQTASTKSLKTVGSSFRESLTLLMTSLNATTPHYVRCIKPNDLKKSFLFDPHRAVQQLRACGVLETIRISAAGFPSRWTYNEFYSRYYMLDKSRFKNKNTKKVADPVQLSSSLIKTLIPDEDNYRLGKTKVFFRSGQVAFLERVRLERLQSSGLVIQKCLRMWKDKRIYLRVKKSTFLLQKYTRGLLARRHAKLLRETRATIVIQKYFRMFKARRDYGIVRSVIIGIQKRSRGFLVRRKTMETRKIKNITIIQSFMRGILARRKIRSHRNKIILMQSCIRRFLAKKSLKTLKIQAKSLEHVQSLNKGLENKIISLQQKLNEQIKETNAIKNSQKDYDKMKNDLINLKSMEKELNEKKKIEQLNKEELTQLKKTLQEKELEKLDILHGKEKTEEKLQKTLKEFENSKELIVDLRSKIVQLESVVNEMNCYKEKCFLLEQELEEVKRSRMESIYKEDAYSNNPAPIATPRESIIKTKYEEKIIKLEKENQQLKESFLNSDENVKIKIEKKENNEEIIESLRKQLEREKSIQKELKNRIASSGNVVGGDGDTSMESTNSPAVAIKRKKNAPHLGMIEYKQEDLERILRGVVLDLPPTLALTSSPIKSLPAYVLFMMIRYTDYINDDERVRTLLTKAINHIKKVIRKKGPENRDVLIFWTCNVLRLLHCLKQYSGDANFQKHNTIKQNEQCLKNFDLSEYRQVLSDHAVWAYMLLIKNLEDTLQPLIVPAILESEHSDTSKSSTKPFHTLLNQLELFWNLLESYGMDSSVTKQIFKQLFYFICAGALNNLLLRRELCHWSKGMDIKFNLSGMHDWSRSKHMAEITETLAPLNEASLVLQVRKTDKDVDSICDMCEALSVAQVTKLLTLYSSKDGLDTDKPSKTLISEVQKRLTEIRRAKGEIPTEENKSSSLLMDTKHSFVVNFEFNPSDVSLEEIGGVPETWGLMSSTGGNPLVKVL